MAVLCARCGALNSDDMSFCVRCGQTLSAEMKATESDIAAFQREIAADRTSHLLVQIAFIGGALFALLTLAFVSLVKVTAMQLVLLITIVISLLILAAFVVIRLGGGKPPASE